MFFKFPIKEFFAKYELKSGFKVFAGNIGRALFEYFIPNKKDNIKEIIFKVSFFAALFAMVFPAVHFSVYFSKEDKNAELINAARKVWYSEESGNFKALKKQNSNLAGWIKIENTEIDLPFYQAKNDDYYLNHDALKQESRYGAVFLSSEDSTDPKTADKNLVIFGRSVQDGSMMTDLKQYRKVSFWKQNPSFSLTTQHGRYTYIVYAVYLINTNPEDDNGYLYHIQKSNFSYDEEFTAWTDEAFQRSMINTGIDVEFGDDILTLVTEADDFEGAKLVVAARRLRENESTVINTSQAHVNHKVRYPKIWYDQRGLDYPY